jgi:heterodisulfide reductase subunit A
MVAVAQHPNIELVTYAEVSKISGYIGNFQVQIKKKAKYVDWDACTGCGLCTEKCPTKKLKDEFDLGMGIRPAIHKLFPQAVPGKPYIDADNCRKLTEDKCGVCEKICPVGAIKFDDQDQYVDYEIGAIVMATGYDLFQWEEAYGEYGYGKYPDVISGLHFERLVSAGGPTLGHIKRPSDGKEPKSVAFIKCVGSRDDTKGKSYCSRACCMYTAKHAYQVKTKIEDSEAYVFYMDVRTAGKNYEEFYQRALNEGATFIRGRVSKIYPKGDKLVLKSEDTLIGRPIEVEADLVVLATAMVPSQGSLELAKTIGFSTDKDGWYQEAHPKLQPVETFSAGVYLAGACQGPKDIPDSVAQASAAAVKVCGLFSKTELATEPMTSEVDSIKCSGCGLCVPICPYNAISLKDIQERGGHGHGPFTRTIAEVNSSLCQGCGACIPACRTAALNLKGYTDEQLVSEVDALCL